MISLPYPMIEMSNGILVVLFFYMTAFAYLYLFTKWRNSLALYRGKGGWVRAARSIYLQQKPAISHAVTATGLFLRTLPLWYLRHATDHHEWQVNWIIRQLALPVLWFGTLLIVLGIMCWIRVVSPFQHASFMWFAMVAIAVGFSVYMAY